MRQGLTVVALYWLVNATGYMADYTGPFGTIETCKAAYQGALSESVLTVCLHATQYDDYLTTQRLYYDSMGGNMMGEGGDT